jgi:circadian clock protein KaiB
MTKYRLKLFITGHTPRSERTIRILHDLCERQLEGRCDLTVIDVQENPELADDEKVLATPTLIRELPLPVRRIVGDLSDAEKVLIGLDLANHSEEGT